MIRIDETLVKKLWDENKSLAEIASSCNCSTAVVRRNLKNMDIICDRQTIILRKYKAERDSKWNVIKSDLDEGMSIHEITKRHHISYENMKKILEEHDYEYNYDFSDENLHSDVYKNQLIKMRDKYTVSEIAKILNKSERTISRHLQQFGLTVTSARLDISDDDIIDYWNKGLTINEIAEMFNCAHDTIAKRLNQYGIACDRTSGIERHFDNVHASDWESIKDELDKCIPVSVIAVNHNIRYESIYRMIENHHYKCKGLIDFDLKQYQERLSKATDDKIYLTAIKSYYDKYGNMPVIYTLSKYLNIDMLSMKQIISKYDLWSFIGNKGPSVKVLRVLHDLDNLNIRYEQNNRQLLKDVNGNFMEIDIYLPDYNIGIEINPTWTHSIDVPQNNRLSKNYHQKKSLLAEDCGVGLIHLYDTDFIEESRYQVFLTQMKSLVSHKTKFGARNCTISKINRDICNEFLNKFHFQGDEHSSTCRYGLFYKSELIGVLTIGPSRYTDDSYEIIRYCMSPYYIVSGCFLKLFKSFLKDIKTSCTIVSYMDLNKRLCTKNVYDKNGFEFESITVPDYVWVNQSGTNFKTRYSVTKSKLVEQGYDVSKSEVQIMRELNYCRVFGSGSKKYVYHYDEV